MNDVERNFEVKTGKSESREENMAGAAEVEIFLAEVHKDEKNAIRHLTNFVTNTTSQDNEEELKKKEEVIMQCGNILAKEKLTEALKEMIQRTRPFLISLGKAKAAKLVRNLVDLFCSIEMNGTPAEAKNFQDIKVELCRECIQWAREQSRIFLRQTLEARLVKLFNEIEDFQNALNLAVTLVKELKKLDDKELMVEVQLEESKACYEMGNLTKARAALTSARTTANAIYVSPRMQAALDMQSGILHAADERDFKTAFSYFYEAFEGYDVLNLPEALRALKYMLLCKIMLNLPDEVHILVQGKLGMKHAGRQLEAMKAVATASKERSLSDFKEACGKFNEELQSDRVVKSHFQSLYDSMLEKNLCRIIDPYSRLEISFIAKQIGLPQQQVEKKLSQMILDKVLYGILDQGEGVLETFEVDEEDEAYALAIDAVHGLNEVCDILYRKANKLN
ncbi:putative 26S proteasome regulatory subunit rpn-6.1 [Trichinella pseudospiralis]|uniref:Putative 26S proteasome regulatory subunit rpn-6.1 n=2 Tax=Trichinella pseudospiralis TaxID=6337 RepID=A0A0V1EME6_TRIPS|nr:putative 26S proteasome regulatory subunit rpn-6.1 [Trichinella pseudospiralis]KRY74776.1 putative 26S proteasome regulatory subunit rpn-6.1 [Trichinella pseudospiralis]KRY84025.1 putative 26S proteasome regulatory subunit rpn-6.1 [Trichinella pseudospiralis]KRZ13136.1 putative 26S proteasome regulatory subunit rpn-6.1 [Trichinella pseudospiralis]KRZ32122.1 putative 26S proteasome regulatory subunit rpn-6.1 [Trichinella pseudospiralis]